MSRELRERKQIDYATLNKGSPARGASAASGSTASSIAGTPRISRRSFMSSGLSDTQDYQNPDDISITSSPSSSSAAIAAAWAEGDDDQPPPSASKRKSGRPKGSKSSGETATPRKRAVPTRRSTRGSRESSVALTEEEGEESEELMRTEPILSSEGSSQENPPTSTNEEGEDEKENLPDLPPPKKIKLSPWSNVTRFVQAMSPSRLFSGSKKGAEQQGTSDGFEEIPGADSDINTPQDDDTLPADEEDERQRKGELDALFLEFEEGVTAREFQDGDEGDELEDGEILAELDIPVTVQSQKRTLWARISDNRVCDLAKPLLDILSAIWLFGYRMGAGFLGIIFAPFQLLFSGLAFIFKVTTASFARILSMLAILIAIAAIFVPHQYNTMEKPLVNFGKLPTISFPSIPDTRSLIALKDSIPFSAPSFDSFSMYMLDFGYWVQDKASDLYESLSLLALSKPFPLGDGGDTAPGLRRWSPFFPGGPFTPKPSELPASAFTSTEDLIGKVDQSVLERIEKVERSILSLRQSLAKSLEEQKGHVKGSDETDRRLVSATQMITLLEKRVGGLAVSQDTIEVKFAASDKNGKEKNRLIEEELKKISAVIAKLEEERSELTALSGRVDELGGLVKKQGVEIEGIRRNLADDVKEMIMSHVPSLLVARLDKASGRVDLDPTFLKHLKDLFATKKEIEELEARQAEKMVADSKAHWTALEKEVFEQFAKKDDLAGLDAAMKTYLDGKADKNAVTSEVLDDRASALMGEMQQRLNEAKSEMDTTMRERVNAALADYKPALDEVVVSKEDVMALVDREIDALKEYFGKVSSSGAVREADVVAIVDVMIKKAIGRYSADTIARPDFALGLAGAYVIQSLTSETYSTVSDTMFGKYFNQKVVRGWGPFYALNPGSLPGQCWSMAGSSGQIGIHLALPVIPTDFTIDHMSGDLAIFPLDKAFQSAPKDLELWAVLDVAGFGKLNLDDPKVRIYPQSRGETKMPAGILMANQRFDPREGSVQTFPVRSDAVRALERLKVVPSSVVLRIVHNWGNKDYTCLYRVRVHGNVGAGSK
ncbi:hypothetical protein HDU76_012376 [Blyttiomyces sp. JEL0837]|nr:hypothetical protein HDU76_012376 [Blyttiomyces sp. JEL0837]